MKSTSIVDIPKKAKDDDLFGIERYQKGLIRFIENSDTPITIAIQGEWGSGKTSLMNGLQEELCGGVFNAEFINQHNKPFYSIWVNTWQYSLLRTHEETLVSIVTSISAQVVKIIDLRHKSEVQRATKSILKLGSKLLKGAGSTVAESVGGEVVGNVVEALLEQEESRRTIQNLRDDLQKAIETCLINDSKIGSPKKGFVVFVDDLDRIDPPLAVEILELLKNIFDIANCVFILAIDYDVVIKGLKPKFGELTDKNEREFRSFFDKIIQLPFSMPVTSYAIDQFLMKSLHRIGYIDQDQLISNELSEKFTLICNLSIGANPRSLKRLMNTVSLITIITSEQNSGDNSRDGQLILQNEENQLLLNFALICIQVAFPALYKIIGQESDFPHWNENFARSLNLNPLEDIEIDRLKSSDLFDEEWERILFRICQRDSYLQNRVSQISQLFNLILKLIPENDNTGEVITDLLALSAVTDVQAYDKPQVAVNSGPILKKLSIQLLPVLEASLQAPWSIARIQSKRISTQLHLSFSPIDWEHTVSVELSNRKGSLCLTLWQHPRAFKVLDQRSEFDVAMELRGIISELEKLKLSFVELQNVHPGFTWRYQPFSSVGKVKDWYVPHLTVDFMLKDLSELESPVFIRTLVAYLYDYLKIWHKLSDLIEREKSSLPE